MTEMLGWASSLVLVLTLARQVRKQWREGQSEGVSRWLFIGQIAASAGFTLYSWLVRNWVFVVTNALLLGNALLGLAIVMRHRRRARLRDGSVAAGARQRRASALPSPRVVAPGTSRGGPSAPRRT